MSNVQDQELIVSHDAQALAAAVKDFYLNEKAADVHFVFKSGERIPAHKLLLVAVSKVFNTMFYGSVPEEEDVKFVDTSADVFKEFLKFFYSNEVQLTMENIGDLMYLGNKYDMVRCLDSCRKFLQSQVKVKNVCQIFGLAIIHDQTELLRMCEKLIINHAKEVFSSADFLDCSKQVLEHILKQDELSCSEVDVFEACMSWVKNVSGQDELTREMVKEHLGSLFYEIRFRSMKYDEFVDLLPAYGQLFPGDEYCEILQIIRKKNLERKLFNRKVRFIYVTNGMKMP